MDLGERLLNLRKTKQLSQEDVAEELNVSRQTISKWETDQSTPDFDKIVPLCELYGITPDELLMKNKINDKTIKQGSKLRKQIESILAILTTIIYLIVSFVTMAWHITWIIWIIFAVVNEIVKLIFMLKGIEDEE